MLKLKEIDRNSQEELRAYLDERTTDIPEEVLVIVNGILKEVKDKKDAACLAYTEKFDGVKLSDMRVTEEEINRLAEQTDPYFRKSMELAAKNIEEFHNAQLPQSYLQQKEDGVYLGERVLPLSSCGIYVPGGRAQYPSSVLMNVIPAKTAGVKRIVMVTPPSHDGSISPNIAYAARLAGVTEIYKIGGAQAIAALAYGTETIPRVDKITGPGNIFVAAAKKLVYGKVDIDMIAGPSEILVIADREANPVYAAADLLSQAEHDPMASAILLTDDPSLPKRVNAEIDRQVKRLPKYEIAKKSIEDYGKYIVCETIEECIQYANAIAPEHLELLIKDPMPYLSLVENAGSVFLGYYTCESIGDYFGGTNHVLPTGGTARFSSALGVDAFLKRSCYLHYTEKALLKNADYIVSMAEEEELQAHANAVLVRVKNEKDR